MSIARQDSWDKAGGKIFDVAILGGGINGACLYHFLTQKGYKVLLCDKEDFGSGTSQTSGMMVWGGLLYLRTLDLKTVITLSRCRDKMIRELDHYVSPKRYRFIPSRQGEFGPGLLQAALHFYWLLGLFRRESPRIEKNFEERSLLKPGRHRPSVTYEEAVLKTSDCRFTLEWLTRNSSPESAALNYCGTYGEFSKKDRLWHLGLEDRLACRKTIVQARYIANCAGVWTDRINEQFGIQTPYRHALSKGVYIGIDRPARLDSLMIFEMGENRDVLTLVPWGPVALWGPTETFPRDIEDGFSPEPPDVRFLLDSINSHFKSGIEKSRIVSLRCGIRPLVVEKDYIQNGYPLDLSRRQIVFQDPEVPWLSSYGGKITGCREMAEKISHYIQKYVPPSLPASESEQYVTGAEEEKIEWPGLRERVPSPAWCAMYESCCTLEDYLRRRTNISQWVPREGLGRNNEYAPALVFAAEQIHQCGREEAEAIVRQYEEKVKFRFDRILEQI